MPEHAAELSVGGKRAGLRGEGTVHTINPSISGRRHQLSHHDPSNLQHTQPPLMKKTVIEAPTRAGAHSSLLTQRLDFLNGGGGREKEIQVIVIIAGRSFANVETLPHN